MYYQEIEGIFSIDTLFFKLFFPFYGIFETSFFGYIQTEQMHKSELFAKKY